VCQGKKNRPPTQAERGDGFFCPGPGSSYPAFSYEPAGSQPAIAFGPGSSYPAFSYEPAGSQPAIAFGPGSSYPAFLIRQLCALYQKWRN